MRKGGQILAAHPVVNVVVTGGAGYIGSVVVEALLDQGHRVLVIDNLVKGHRDAVAPGADFVHLDLSEGARVEGVLRDFQTDAVVHMAASSLVGESVIHPARYYDNNVRCGLSLLEAMHAASVKRMVFSSTAAVYGEPVKQPIDEDDPTAPTNPYGETKLAFEHALRWFGVAYGLSSISLRYFNAAGATPRNGERHDPETHLIPLVLDVAAGRRPHITVFGNDYPTRDGTCVRDYIHVLDLAAAHVAALGKLEPGGECRSYNLGCGDQGYSVMEIIDAARTITGREIAVTIAPRRAGDPAALIASSRRIHEDLKWSPRFGLDDIISSAWTWMIRAGLDLKMEVGSPNRQRNGVLS
ncbi:MAG TPA: UDP-glucose 4-epimerase GalE [Vicinamibacterales bacterium]|nr:UDP-glucose 4-epimerase GalE [Vicinamibacterales bacterium]